MKLMMIDLDGTPTKSKLGANAILGIVIAVAQVLLWELVHTTGMAKNGKK